MFNNCCLVELHVSCFDTSQVTAFQQMFEGCHCPLINVSNFDTSNVKTMRQMFYCCQVVRLDCSSFLFREADCEEIFNEAYVQALLFSSQNNLACLIDQSFVCHSLIIK